MSLRLCSSEGVYEAGGTLSASWQISRVPAEEIQCLELSVLWHTEGKGDEDLQVHHFHRISESQVRRLGVNAEQAIECVLPATPLSYQGRLISVIWCARLRLYLSSGREIVAEQPFYLVSANMHLPCAAGPDAGTSAASDEGIGELSSGSQTSLVGHATRL